MVGGGRAHLLVLADPLDVGDGAVDLRLRRARASASVSHGVGYVGACRRGRTSVTVTLGAALWRCPDLTCTSLQEPRALFT